jgi:hypothetical protein
VITVEPRSNATHEPITVPLGPEFDVQRITLGSELASSCHGCAGDGAEVTCSFAPTSRQIGPTCSFGRTVASSVLATQSLRLGGSTEGSLDGIGGRLGAGETVADAEVDACDEGDAVGRPVAQPASTTAAKTTTRALEDPVHPAMTVLRTAALDVHQRRTQPGSDLAGAVADGELAVGRPYGADRGEHGRRSAGERLA